MSCFVTAHASASHGQERRRGRIHGLRLTAQPTSRSDLNCL